MEKLKIYNTPFEVGVRVLIILYFIKKPVDLQRLINYDYLMLHYGDIDNNYESIHPANPYHITELYVRRKLIQDAIHLISQKGLLDVTLSKSGFLYSASIMGKNFLKCFDSNYFTDLKQFARLVVEKFEGFSNADFENYISNNIGKWKDEFETESLFRGNSHE